MLLRLEKRASNPAEEGSEKVSVLIFVIVLVGVALIGLALWPLRGSWGINLSLVRCPRCDTEQPRFRKPKNWHQAIWGGYTYRTCGQEIDKYGNALE
jgi:hypothetical protein